MKCYCQSKLSSQSSSLTLPLEREVNLECQSHHSWIFAIEHLQFSHWCCRIALPLYHTWCDTARLELYKPRKDNCWNVETHSNTNALEKRDHKTNPNLSERAGEQIQIPRTGGKEWQCLLSLRACMCWQTPFRCPGRPAWDTDVSGSYKVTFSIVNLAEQRWDSLECNASAWTVWEDEHKLVLTTEICKYDRLWKKAAEHGPTFGEQVPATEKLPG